MISKSLQTENYLESLEELIKQKDSKIKDLGEKLKSAHFQIQKLLYKQTKRFGNSTRVSDYKIDDIEVTSKDITFHDKQPLDTANIADINDSVTKSKRSNMRISIPKPSLKFRKSFSNKPQLPNIEYKTSVSSNLQNYSQLDEMIFSNQYDKNAWSSTVNNFRNDPQLLSDFLRNKETSHKDPPKSLKKNESNSIRHEGYKQYRPFSANIERKWQEIDWSKTVLDNYASKGILEFNSLRDMTILSPYDIESYLRDKYIIDTWEKTYYRGIKTLDKLINELMLPKGYFIIPPKSVDSLEIIMQECDKLFRARALVLKVLMGIHKREDLLLKIMRFEREDSSLRKNYLLLVDINQEILQTIGFLSQAGLYIGEFVYLGEDYSQKILQDDTNIKDLFPGLKKLEEI
jgi:hypothetical protein